MATPDVYQIVTDKIINLLEKGTIPWRKTWSSGAGMAPCNAVSKKPYQGINRFLLGVSQYDSAYWLTFKQAQELGGHVRKGEKATPCIFYKTWQKENEEGKVDYIPVLRYYSLFNADQCDGLDLPKPVVQTWPENEQIDKAEQVIVEMPDRPAIEIAGSQPCYIPASDKVIIPEIIRFHSSGEYYSALFHELTHSTGHAKRLARDGIVNADSFGSSSYSREELVAEMGAAFLCAYCGIDNTLENSAAYVQGWLKALRNDSKLAIKAASQAQKAANYILNIQE